MAQAIQKDDSKQRKLVRLFTDGGILSEILDEQRKELRLEPSRLEKNAKS